jgi:hypothetical protein
MKINRSASIYTHDTSNGRANDIVEELSYVGRELNELNQVTRELAEDKTKDADSPYHTDRPGYNPTRVKGTERETEWKKVNLSQEQDLRDVDKEIVEKKQKYVQDLKNKLNII